MNDPTQDQDRPAQRAAQWDAALRSLQHWEQKAEAGEKLGPTQRLQAALHLSAAWRQANKAGLSKEEFQERVYARLKRGHARRESFKLANYILPRRIDQITTEVIEAYTGKSEPGKAFEPYLVGVTVAAEFCSADPREWKVNLLADLNLPTALNDGLQVEAADDAPFLNLSVLLQALCRSVGQRSGLSGALEAIRVPGARCLTRWDMFEERLHPYPTGCMEEPYSPIYPVPEMGIYCGEMLALPSVALLQVPYLIGRSRFALIDEAEVSNTDNPWDMPGRIECDGDLVYFREIRLCIVPDGRGDLTAALESRPRIEVYFPNRTPFSGKHFIWQAIDPDLNRQFYAREWPTVRLASGQSFRIARLCHRDRGGDEDRWFEDRPMLDPEQGGGGVWPHDPVRCATAAGVEPGYLSYTTAAMEHLRYWLEQDWALAGVSESCPWAPVAGSGSAPLALLREDVPPLSELNFPTPSHATWIEWSLHDGKIEEALMSAARRVVSEIARLQRTHREQRDRHVQTLLDRWKFEETKGR